MKIKNQDIAPVLFCIYNRLEYTKKTFHGNLAKRFFPLKKSFSSHFQSIFSSTHSLVFKQLILSFLFLYTRSICGNKQFFGLSFFYLLKSFFCVFQTIVYTKQYWRYILIFYFHFIFGKTVNLLKKAIQS